MYKMGSSACMAAIHHYQDTIHQLASLKFGLMKKYDPANTYNYFLTFDKQILHDTKNYSVNQEVDVLNGDQCFQRAFIKDIYKNGDPKS